MRIHSNSLLPDNLATIDHRYQKVLSPTGLEKKSFFSFLPLNMNSWKNQDFDTPFIAGSFSAERHGGHFLECP